MTLETLEKANKLLTELEYEERHLEVVNKMLKDWIHTFVPSSGSKYDPARQVINGDKIFLSYNSDINITTSVPVSATLLKNMLNLLVAEHELKITEIRRQLAAL